MRLATLVSFLKHRFQQQKYTFWLGSQIIGSYTAHSNHFFFCDYLLVKYFSLCLFTWTHVFKAASSHHIQLRPCSFTDLTKIIGQTLKFWIKFLFLFICVSFEYLYVMIHDLIACPYIMPIGWLYIVPIVWPYMVPIALLNIMCLYCMLMLV